VEYSGSETWPYWTELHRVEQTSNFSFDIFRNFPQIRSTETTFRCLLTPQSRSSQPDVRLLVLKLIFRINNEPSGLKILRDKKLKVGLGMNSIKWGLNPEKWRAQKKMYTARRWTVLSDGKLEWINSENCKRKIDANRFGGNQKGEKTKHLFHGSSLTTSVHDSIIKLTY